MFRLGILHTGKAMVGEEVPVRGVVLGAGVGPGSGSNRVKFQGELEQDCVLANKSWVWGRGS